MSSKARSTTTSKKVVRDRRILAKARREDGPVSAGIQTRPRYDDPITFTREAIEFIVRQLEGAQRLAIEAAIPPRYLDAGPERAIEAYRTIRCAR